MRRILTFLFILVILSLTIILVPALTSPTGLMAQNQENNKNELPTFRMYTKAVCDNVSGFVVCHDELFANCGSIEYLLPKDNITGQGIFDKNWEDPRYT